MLEKFTVIDLIKTRSASVVTFTGTGVNTEEQALAAAQELGYPPFVQLLIDQKGKQFAVRVCKEDAPNAVSFSKPMGDQKYQIKINNIAVVDLVRKTMGWNAEDNWNVPGVYFADEQAIIYSLETAYAPKAKGGWTAKHEKEAAAAAAEAAIEEAMAK